MPLEVLLSRARAERRALLDVLEAVRVDGPRPADGPHLIDPRAIAAGQTEEAKVYVTHFLALLRDDARTVAEKEGRDDGKDGRDEDV